MGFLQTGDSHLVTQALVETRPRRFNPTATQLDVLFLARQEKCDELMI